MTPGLIILLAVIILGNLWLCWDTWQNPTWIAGRGTVITLFVSLAMLGLLFLTQ